MRLFRCVPVLLFVASCGASTPVSNGACLESSPSGPEPVATTEEDTSPAPAVTRAEPRLFDLPPALDPNLEAPASPSATGTILVAMGDRMMPLVTLGGGRMRPASSQVCSSLLGAEAYVNQCVSRLGRRATPPTNGRSCEVPVRGGCMDDEDGPRVSTAGFPNTAATVGYEQPERAVLEEVASRTIDALVRETGEPRATARIRGLEAVEIEGGVRVVATADGVRFDRTPASSPGVVVVFDVIRGEVHERLALASERLRGCTGACLTVHRFVDFVAPPGGPPLVLTSHFMGDSTEYDLWHLDAEPRIVGRAHNNAI